MSYVNTNLNQFSLMPTRKITEHNLISTKIDKHNLNHRQKQITFFTLTNDDLFFLTVVVDNL